MSKGNLLKDTPYSEITATLEVLAHLGITPEHLDRLRSDRSYAQQVAGLMLGGWPKDSAYHKLARSIMGRNFWGVEEWQCFYGVNFTEEQLRRVAVFPWDDDILTSPCLFNKGKLVCETHFAFLGMPGIEGYPLTILTWDKIRPKHVGDFCFPKDLHKEEFSMKATPELRWYLMPIQGASCPQVQKQIHKGEAEPFYLEQVVRLPQYDYEIATAVVEVTKNLLRHIKCGVPELQEDPISSWNTWCQDTCSRGRVVVSYSYQLKYSRYYSVTNSVSVQKKLSLFSHPGLAVSRKPSRKIPN